MANGRVDHPWMQTHLGQARGFRYRSICAVSHTSRDLIYVTNSSVEGCQQIHRGVFSSQVLIVLYPLSLTFAYLQYTRGAIY